MREEEGLSIILKLKYFKILLIYKRIKKVKVEIQLDNKTKVNIINQYFIIKLGIKSFKNTKLL